MKFYAILCMRLMTRYLVFASPTQMTQKGAFSSDICPTRPWKIQANVKPTRILWLRFLTIF